MAPNQRTVDLLRHLAGKPGHDEVKADFRSLLVEEFGVELGALDFERRVPEVRGRLDALIGRTVFEAKSDLEREWGDVERRMPDYLADREREEREHFVGIASDGLRWAVFELRDGALQTVKRTTLDPEKSDVFLAWLDGAVALRASLPPDPLTIRSELGGDSVAFHLVREELAKLWERLRLHPAEALKRQLWADLLKLVHGRDVDSDMLWFRHTYLVIVAKCIAVAVMDLAEDDPARMLSGEAFSSAGIQGAVESDFFDWVIAEADGVALVRRIMAHVRRFRLREVESDVLKILYESLIDRDERHGLGEYYTPDWLAAKVVRHAVTDPLQQRVLDPACGSGTFLFHAVRRVIEEAEEAGIPASERAMEAARLVTGLDIHPVAVIIARITYLLALAPALINRRGSFAVPVYLGDSMQLGLAQNLNQTALEIRVPPPPAGAEPAAEVRGREVLSFPETFCRDPGLFDKAVERMRTASLAGQDREQFEAALTQDTEAHIRLPPDDALERLNRRGPPALSEEHRLAISDMGATYALFDRLRRQRRDTIWAYVARNLSRPLSLATGGGWAHVLVGNPPWVAYRHMSADLQKRFKELAQGEKVYVGGRFATQNDLSALFTVRASHLYLRPAGRIAFVLPLAALTRGQFESLRLGRFGSYNIAWEEAWTMDDRVVPLFPVPSCVVFGRKRAIAKPIPSTVRAYSGTLPFRDASEAVADARLIKNARAEAPQAGEFSGGSEYRSAFRQGATLVPRMLSLVERKSMGRIGADPSAPMVMSRRTALEKQPWRDTPGIENQVEAEFLRPVLLGESILPFRIVTWFEGVVPVSVDGRVLDAAAAVGENRGHDKLAGWLRKAEALWLNLSATAAMTLIQRWNFQRGLSNQFPIATVRVVFAASGSLPAACIVRDRRAIIEHKLYWTAPSSEQEAHYLCAILNSETARARTERYQSRGQFGARDFDKVIFNLPIPLFDKRDQLHLELAAAGAHAEIVAGLAELKEGEKFQRARKRVRDALAEEGVGGEIEKLVEKLLDG
jgi:SAM-dependent methyltransferase